MPSSAKPQLSRAELVLFPASPTNPATHPPGKVYFLARISCEPQDSSVELSRAEVVLLPSQPSCSSSWLRLLYFHFLQLTQPPTWPPWESLFLEFCLQNPSLLPSSAQAPAKPNWAKLAFFLLRKVYFPASAQKVYHFNKSYFWCLDSINEGSSIAKYQLNIKTLAGSWWVPIISLLSLAQLSPSLFSYFFRWKSYIGLKYNLHTTLEVEIWHLGSPHNNKINQVVFVWFSLVDFWFCLVGLVFLILKVVFGGNST